MMDLVLFLVATVVAYLCTSLMRKYALRSALLDMPGSRSLHSIPTPRGGGVGIVAGTLLGLALLRFVLIKAQLPPGLFLLCVFASAVAVLGFCDDRYSLSAKLRFSIQCLSAASFVGSLSFLFGIEQWQNAFLGLPFGVSAPLLVLYQVWMTNLYNFMDGSDGIAALQSATVSLGFSLLAYMTGSSLVAPISMAIAGACIGFLILNWQPAKIFMGDVGSVFLGFFLSGLSMYAALTKEVAFVSAVILHGTFVVDATVTLVTRLFRKKKPHQAHRSHTYQRWIQRGMSHRTVALRYAAVNLVWLLPSAWFANLASSVATQVLILLIAWVPLIFIAVKAKAGFD